MLVGGLIYLGIAALVAYFSARSTGDGLGSLALFWPLMLAVMPFVLLIWLFDYLSDIGNRQHRERR